MGERWIHPWINDVSVGCLATGKKIAEFQVVIEPMTSVTAVWCCHQRATRTSSGIRHFTVLFFLPCLASTEGLTMWFSLNVMQERWKGAARTREWIVQIMVAWQKLKEHLENSEFQLRIESTTSVTPIAASTHWAIEEMLVNSFACLGFCSYKLSR